jgi:hypothetical protein
MVSSNVHLAKRLPRLRRLYSFEDGDRAVTRLFGFGPALLPGQMRRHKPLGGFSGVTDRLSPRPAQCIRTNWLCSRCLQPCSIRAASALMVHNVVANRCDGYMSAASGRSSDLFEAVKHPQGLGSNSPREPCTDPGLLFGVKRGVRATRRRKWLWPI